MQYDVFISCKSEDYKHAEEIYEFLEANGIHTFLASKELRRLGDSEYRKAISKALKSAYHMIVFASQPEYIDTTWVYYEWDWFINAKLKGFKPGQIVTILKDVNVDDVNSDLWKYESFVFSNYKDNLLSYVETPAYLQRMDEDQKRKEEEERAKRQQEEERRKRKEAKDKLIAMAEDYRGKVANLSSVDAKKIVSVLRTMGITTHSCPVCKTEVDVEKTYCPACGWTISPIDDIEGADYLSLVNYSQLDIARRLYNKLVDADKETSRTSTILEENRKLHKSVVELTERIEREEAKFLWGEQELKTIRLQRDALEQSNRELVLRIDNLLKERACICERQTVTSSQTNKSQKKERTGAVHLVYADLPNKVVFEKALDKDVEACREMARRYYYGLNGYRKNIEAANNYLNKVGLPLYEVLEPSSLPKSLKFSYEDKEFYMVLSPDGTYYMGNIKAIGKDFSWLNSSWFQVGGSAAIAAGAVALGVLAWPMAIVLFLRAISSWSNEKDKNNQANRIKVDESLCNELSKSSGYKFAKPTDKELEGVKQEVKPYCVVLRIMDNPRLKQV